ncbi:MAG: hypothetical protein ACRC9Y_17885 [Aeromonas veronii]
MSVFMTGLLLVVFMMIMFAIQEFKNVWVRGVLGGFFVFGFAVILHFFTADVINFGVEFYSALVGL